MKYKTKIESLHLWFRQHRWLLIFTWGVRIVLSFAFIMAGGVKIFGERFTDLHNNQPMGHYLQALFETGYYYTFIGYVQVLAGVALLIPRTSLLGVCIYLPIILNIAVLSWSVRFEGSIFTSPLMVIACLYLMWWDYDRLKYILPFRREKLVGLSPKQDLHNKFPWYFALLVVVVLVGVTVISVNIFSVVPRNTLEACYNQFIKDGSSEYGKQFCDCIHKQGLPLDSCLEIFSQKSQSN